MVVPPVHLLGLVLPLRPVKADQPAPQPLPLTHLAPRHIDHPGESGLRGVGPSTTFGLAWLEAAWYCSRSGHSTTLYTSRFKKCCVNCELLFYPSTEYKHSFNVYWHDEGAAGLSCTCTELSIWEFPFLRGTCQQGGNSIWYCVNGMHQKDTLDSAAYTCILVSYQRLSPQFQFSLCIDKRQRTILYGTAKHLGHQHLYFLLQSPTSCLPPFLWPLFPCQCGQINLLVKVR